MRLIISTFILLLSVFSGNAESRQLNDIDPAAWVGVYVKDLRSGNIVAREESDRAFIPASIQKTLPVAAALTAYGPEYRLVTTVTMQGKLAGGRLHGNIVISPTGDPTLGTGTGFVTNLVDSLWNKGVRSVDGRILIDGDRWPDQGFVDTWEIDDTRYDYGAGWFAFNFDHNLQGDTSNPVANPADVAQERILTELQRRGIDVEGGLVLPADSVEELVYEHHSPMLVDMCRDLMERSDNLMAEAVLRMLAPYGSRSEAIKEQDKILVEVVGARLGLKRQYDGSGLSRGNLLTPRGLGALLEAMAGNRAFVSAFPAAGRQGTVRKLLRGTPLEGRVVVKSGSMTGVLCYAGYKLDDNGVPTHVIVLMVNNTFKPTGEVRRALEKLILKLSKTKAA